MPEMSEPGLKDFLDGYYKSFFSIFIKLFCLIEKNLPYPCENLPFLCGKILMPLMVFSPGIINKF